MSWRVQSPRRMSAPCERTRHKAIRHEEHIDAARTRERQSTMDCRPADEVNTREERAGERLIVAQASGARSTDGKDVQRHRLDQQVQVRALADSQPRHSIPGDLGQQVLGANREAHQRLVTVLAQFDG